MKPCKTNGSKDKTRQHVNAQIVIWFELIRVYFIEMDKEKIWSTVWMKYLHFNDKHITSIYIPI